MIKHQRPVARRMRGFNMIELVITVAIAAIVLSVGIPSFRDFVLNSRRAAAINEFIGAIEYSRAEVLKRGGRVTLCPSTDGASCSTDWSAGWLVFVNTADDCTVDGTDLTPATSPAAGKFMPNNNQGIAITAKDQNGNALNCYSFRTFNVSNTKPGTVTFCDSLAASDATRRRAVVIDVTGRARISTTSYTNTALACS